MDDPLDWMPAFLRDRWDAAVESLRAEGVKVDATRPTILGAQDPKSGGDVEASVVVKMYESGDNTIARVTHGDADRDVTWTFTLDIQRRGRSPGLARKAAHEAVQVLVRILELYRSNPQADWNRIENIHSATVENYWDYQQRAITFTLHRYGQPMVKAVLQDLD